MPEKTVLLGPDNLQVEAGSHIIMLYQQEPELLEVLPAFFSEGLKNDDFCALVYTEEETLNEIKDSLEKKYKIEKENLEVNFGSIPYQEFYFENGQFDAYKIYEKIESLIKKKYIQVRPIRSAGDMRWVSKDIFNELYYYEVGLSDKFNSKNIILLCAYYVKKLSVEQIIKLIQSHLLILFKEGESWKMSETVERDIYEKRIDELEKFKKFSVGRELTMIELKEKIKELERQLSEYKKNSK